MSWNQFDIIEPSHILSPSSPPNVCLLVWNVSHCSPIPLFQTPFLIAYNHYFFFVTHIVVKKWVQKELATSRLLSQANTVRTLCHYFLNLSSRTLKPFSWKNPFQVRRAFVFLRCSSASSDTCSMSSRNSDYGLHTFHLLKMFSP